MRLTNIYNKNRKIKQKKPLFRSCRNPVGILKVCMRYTFITFKYYRIIGCQDFNAMHLWLVFVVIAAVSGEINSLTALCGDSPVGADGSPNVPPSGNLGSRNSVT